MRHRRQDETPWRSAFSAAALPQRFVEHGRRRGREIERPHPAAHRQADELVADLARVRAQAPLLAADADHHLAGEIDVPGRLARRRRRRTSSSRRALNRSSAWAELEMRSTSSHSLAPAEVFATVARPAPSRGRAPAAGRRRRPRRRASMRPGCAGPGRPRPAPGSSGSPGRPRERLRSAFRNFGGEAVVHRLGRAGEVAALRRHGPRSDAARTAPRSRCRRWPAAPARHQHRDHVVRAMAQRLAHRMKTVDQHDSGVPRAPAQRPSIRTTARAAMPSPRPIAPKPSFVVALRPTADGSTPSTAAMRRRIDSR